MGGDPQVYDSKHQSLGAYPSGQTFISLGLKPLGCTLTNQTVFSRIVFALCSLSLLSTIEKENKLFKVAKALKCHAGCPNCRYTTRI